MRPFIDLIVIILGLFAGLFLIAIGDNVVEDIAERNKVDEVEEEKKKDRFDKVNQLMSNNQIRSFVEKNEKEIGYQTNMDDIDKLIDDDSEDYKLEAGEVTSSSIEVEHKYREKNGVHYIEVTILNRRVFTEYYKEFIYTRVRHRTVDYDIGKTYIQLTVDKNEYGYKLLSKKIITEEELKNVN